MIKKKDIKKLYSNYSEKVQAYMLSVCVFLEEKFGEINPSWGISLDMLASNLDIFNRCEEQIQKDGIMIENRWGCLEKHPLLKVQTDSQIQIVKLLNEFGLTLRALSKLKVDEEENDDFLTELMGD